MTRGLGPELELSRLGRSVLAVTTLLAVSTLLAVGAAVLASLPPRPIRSALTAVHAVSLRIATYWLVVVALLAVADRLTGSEHVDEQTIRRLAAIVFVGALAIEMSPLARLVVDPAGSIETARLAERSLSAVQIALYPAGLFLGTGVAVLTLRDATASDLETTSLPLAPRDGLGHESAPAALWRLSRTLVGVAGVSTALGVVATLVATSDPYLVLTVVDAGVDALNALFDHLVVGVVLFALFVYGVTTRTLVGAAGAVLAVTFLLGLGLAIVGLLAGVVVVGATVTPIPAVESADLVDWPDPFALDALVLVGSVVAAGVGLRTIHGHRGGGLDHSGKGTSDSSDA